MFYLFGPFCFFRSEMEVHHFDDLVVTSLNPPPLCDLVSVFIVGVGCPILHASPSAIKLQKVCLLDDLGAFGLPCLENVSSTLRGYSGSGMEMLDTRFQILSLLSEKTLHEHLIPCPLWICRHPDITPPPTHEEVFICAPLWYIPFTDCSCKMAIS